MTRAEALERMARGFAAILSIIARDDIRDDRKYREIRAVFDRDVRSDLAAAPEMNVQKALLQSQYDLHDAREAIRLAHDLIVLGPGQLGAEEEVARYTAWLSSPAVVEALKPRHESALQRQEAKTR